MNHSGPKTAKPRRSTGGGRAGRMRPGVDKGSLSEGVYSNPRMTHTATVIIGCVVQVQVKNEKVYEGIFKTFSPQMDVVLERAHLVLDDSSSSGPSAEELIEKPLILKSSEIVMMSALNVDLDYASKDSFTDTSISKFNGQVQEKELQPWEGDEPSADGGIEDMEAATTHRPTNGTGWDPNEMFKTNMEKFNVSSSFDPSLSQYTTPLKQENTKEYEERLKFASKMAQEIENSDAYKASLALENGDKDEEDAFSAVVRGGSEKTDGRYVPPHQRKMQGQGRAVRTNSQSSSGGGQSRDSVSPTNKMGSGDEPKVNGEKDEMIEVDKVIVSAASPTEENRPELDRSGVQNNVAKDRKPITNTKSRDIQIQELKKFSNDFKLSDNQDRKARGGNVGPNERGQVGRVEAPIQPQISNSVMSEPKPPTPEKSEQKSPPHQPPVDEKQKDEVKRREETVKKSTLNPHAKEFVLNPNAKPFCPQQTSTTPRPQTQSPVMPLPMYQPMPYSIVPQPHHSVVQAQQQRPPMNVKKAVVSVQPRPEFVTQATGTPLMANTPQSPYMPYLANPHLIGHRMINPHLQQAHQQAVSEQQMSSQQGQQQAVFGSFAPPGAQAVPAHLGGQHGGQGHQHPNPAHVAPHHQPTPPHSHSHSHSQSTSHMNSQNQPNGPPTPGPVQHAPPPQHPGAGHPGQGHGHPPSSQTPQPHGIIYQQPMSQPQGHPPLQPSPHTPTSPQNMYPTHTQMSYAPTYSYASQTGMQGIPQMTFTHTAPQSTVTHAQHQHQHVAHAQPQFVMMQNPQAVAAAAAANQMQHAHHGQVPHGATVQAPHLQGKAAFTLPGPMAGQAGPAMMPQQFSSQNVPMHYVPHHAMPSQVGGPQVSYPHAS